MPPLTPDRPQQPEMTTTSVPVSPNNTMPPSLSQSTPPIYPGQPLAQGQTAGSPNPMSLYYLSPTPAQLHRRAVAEKMFSMRGLLLSLFGLWFAYFFSAAVLLCFEKALGMTLSVLVFCVFTYIVFYRRASEKNPAALWLYLPIGVIAAGYSLHYNPLSHAAMTLTLLTLLGLQLILFTNPDRKEPFSADMAAQFVRRILLRPFRYLGAPFRNLKLLKNIKSRSLKNLFLAICGLVIALPVIALLLMWFNSADAVFAAGYKNFMESIERILKPDLSFIFNLFMALLFGTPFAAMLLYNDNDRAGEPAQTEPKGFSATLFSTFLSAIAIVMTLFVVTQFTTFFFAESSGILARMGHSEYARQGFFELTYASGLVFAVAACVMIFCRKREDGRLPLFVNLALALIGLCNLIVLVSALLRMSLYVSVYDLSIKRLMALWFMPILGLCTLFLIIKCFLPGLKALKAMAYTVLVAVCLLAVFNTDRYVARTRVDRYLKTADSQALDTDYFWQLSYACYPEIERLLEDGSLLLNENETQTLLHIQEHHHRSVNSTRKYDGLYGFTLDQLSIPPAEEAPAE